MPNRVLKTTLAVSTLVLAGVAILHAQVGAASSIGDATELTVVHRPELVQCTPVSLTPCISVTVTPSDASGKPIAVALPVKGRLLQSVQIQSDSAEATPFFVSTGSGEDVSQKPNVVLIEVDISGSMNTPVSSGVSRFAAAQAAIAKYLEGMQEGVDEIAIVPFESHHVVSTIQAAVFTNKREEAMAQLKALPEPGPKNNTALFQAVFSGVQAMQTEMASLVKPGLTVADFQPRVIVMTDGKNEVAKGDDADLLDGPLGMQQAVAKVASSGFDVIGIGFGDRTQIDTEALQHLSKRIFLATTGDELIHILHSTRPLRTSELQISFVSPWGDRSSLASKDPQFSIVLALPDGRRLMSPLIRYTTPAMSAPLYQREASAEEMQALIDARPTTDSGWTTVLRGLLIFSGCGALLLLLWFWVPRLIWGNELTGDMALGANRRWGKDTGVKASAVQLRTVANAPDGFDADQVLSKQQRSAAQITQVQPREGFTKTNVMRDAH